MRTLEPSLPSIASVLAFSQSQPELRSPSRRPPSRRLRRKASHPTGTHTPRCPPQLDSDHLMKTVDYRFSSPPTLPLRSSYALPDIFESDEFEIVKSSDEGSSASSTACSARPSRSPAKARAKAKAVCSHILVRAPYRCASRTLLTSPPVPLNRILSIPCAGGCAVCVPSGGRRI
ncbi:hypothetical protein DENSPDRAFT_845272 [Dentipellis sp. KUC8613]|nr:hypothetical protein DENSPDRAFT_845272 [Dentipellis sp. KUC8613]